MRRSRYLLLTANAAMASARELGRAARRIAPPNPWVGCVLLRDGVEVGAGHTHAPGGDHAEIAALKVAGERSRGSTALVTLEPCSHRGRTGACTEALVAAGVARVVYAIGDPDPHVNGSGRAALASAGVEVVCLQDSDARSDQQLVDHVSRDLAPYLWHRLHNRPWVIAKIAMSLDARIAAADGSSKWITGEPSRRDAHELRADSQAILVGSSTARIDQPALTVRDAVPPSVPPLRVVLDSRGVLPASGALADTSHAPTLIATTDAASTAWSASWTAHGAEVLRLPSADGRVDLDALLNELGARGVLQLMVEGGSTVTNAFLEAGQVQTMRCYIAPRLLGTDATPAFDLRGVRTLEQARHMSTVSVERFGEDVRLEFDL